MRATEAGLGELAASLAEDRDAAFPDLVHALTGSLYSGALRLTHNRHDAEEVTQEAFLRAYRALGRYPASQTRTLQLRPWLWTIALNLCRNHARSRSRRPQTMPLVSDDEHVAPDSTEDAAMASTTQVWRERLETLPEPVRTAVVLRHVVGLSYAEIASVVGRPDGTVKSDVHRGLAKLRTMLIEEGAAA